MLKRRLIPKLLIKRLALGRQERAVLVTTAQFNSFTTVGDPVSQAKIYEAQFADELIVINIDGTSIGEDKLMLDLIERLASETFMPLCVGGGVRNLSDFETLLKRGADKVGINSAALEHPELITEAANKFGSQCVVVSADFRTTAEGTQRVMLDRARVPTKYDVISWAKQACELGAGELLICDADRDGGGGGLNIQVGRDIAEAVPIPIILSGGCGRAEHFVSGFTQAKADGVAAGTYFAHRDQNPMQTRSHISNAGVPIRMETE